MKRPLGVVLSCIVLGILSALLLFSAAGTAIIGAVVMQSPSLPRAQPQAPPVTPGFLLAVFLGLSLLSALCAAWSITTIVGLAKLRNWARISMLLIASALLLVSGFSTLGVVVAALIGPSAVATPGLTPGSLRVVYVFEGLVWILLAALAVWWLVYFNLRAIRASFRPTYASPHPHTYNPGQLLDPAIFPNLPAAPPYPGSAVYAPPPPPPGRLERVPVPILVLGCLSIVAALFCLPYLFISYPLFFFGFTFEKPGTQVVFGLFTVITASIGIGLLRLQDRARLAAYAFLGLNLLNVLVFLTPWGRARFEIYMQTIMGRFQYPGAPNINAFFSGPALLCSTLFALAVYAAIFWTLHHYRGAFKPSTPPLA